MKEVEFVFDGESYYILSHRELGLNIFGGHSRFLWFKNKMKIDDVKMISKEHFSVLKAKHGSKIIRE